MVSERIFLKTVLSDVLSEFIDLGFWVNLKIWFEQFKNLKN